MKQRKISSSSLHQSSLSPLIFFASLFLVSSQLRFEHLLLPLLSRYFSFSPLFLILTSFLFCLLRVVIASSSDKPTADIIHTLVFGSFFSWFETLREEKKEGRMKDYVREKEGTMKDKERKRKTEGMNEYPACGEKEKDRMCDSR